MMLDLFFTALFFAPAPAPAPAAEPAPAPAPADEGASDPAAAAAAAAAEAPPADGDGDDGGVTYYQFSGLGIDGELRTPALLQFLSRIGGEFETVGIPHRSFMPELRQTVMEDAL
jgi:hypothetical protein